jgi:hypothetical protein
MQGPDTGFGEDLDGHAEGVGGGLENPRGLFFGFEENLERHVSVRINPRSDFCRLGTFEVLPDSLELRKCGVRMKFTGCRPTGQYL